ncbi:J domain-containing protein [Ramlibacter sp.]|uniref:J domain-containing protein n=1 Tax=Ramlibacter sp. TaxID=1917967 RepID=UPI00262FB73F|nr:J domain-containing protein [Ramlibacter sp.]
MSDLQALRLAPAGADRRLTPEQQRFNGLVEQIEQARAALQAWRDSIADYRKGYAKTLGPLQAQLRAARRRWALALDAAGDRPGWSRAEQAALSELVVETAGDLLALDGSDAQLAALFARHGDGAFEAPSPDPDPDPDRDLGDAAPPPDSSAARRRKSGAVRRRAQEEQDASQSVRDVFRKLASALHPDRATDPVERATRTGLMQEANRAYAQSDLLALLELQLRIEQVDAAHVAAMDARRLRHYSKVLAGQLDELRAEIRRVDAEFSDDVGLEPLGTLHPRKMGELLRRQAASLRDGLAQMELLLRMLADPVAARRWLKSRR